MTERRKKPARKRSQKTNDYEVGYGKPPMNTRFQKGRSGNPKGRQKESKNLKTMIEAMLFAPIQIQQNGKTTTVAALEAILLKLRNNALGGDFRSAVQAIQLASHVRNPEDADDVSDAPPLDPKMLAGLMRDYLDHNGLDGSGSEKTGPNGDEQGE